MSTKNKRKFKIIVVGSGLSSLNFIDSFLNKNKKIDVISPDFEQELNKSNNFNNHLFKIFFIHFQILALLYFFSFL